MRHKNTTRDKLDLTLNYMKICVLFMYMKLNESETDDNECTNFIILTYLKQLVLIQTTHLRYYLLPLCIPF